jgi:hypothetical protein
MNPNRKPVTDVGCFRGKRSICGQRLWKVRWLLVGDCTTKPLPYWVPASTRVVSAVSAKIMVDASAGQQPRDALWALPKRPSHAAHSHISMLHPIAALVALNLSAAP